MAQPPAPNTNQKTLYQCIVEGVLHSIERGAFSFDLPICTESKLMEQYGVSRITARRAMTELERKGILYRKRGVGSFVSRDIYARQAEPVAGSNVFAFIFPFNITRSGLTAAFQAANSVLMEHGYCASIYITEDDPPARGRTLLSQLNPASVAGIAYYPKTADIHLTLLNKFIFQRKPAVVLDIPSNCPYVSAVYSDNYSGSALLFEHLVALGHRNIAYVSGVEPDARPTVCDRLSAYVLGHEQAGLPLRADYILTTMSEAFRRATDAQTGQSNLQCAVRALVERGVTAVLCEHDEIAFEMQLACKDLGIQIPEQLSICGYDDSEWAHVLPGNVTTVRQNMEQIGIEVANLLLDGLQGTVRAATQRIIPTRFIAGTTTGPAPAAQSPADKPNGKK